MKRYCDYDAIVHYKAGEFASRHADSLKGKLELVERDELEPWEAESFLDGKYETFLSREPIVMYRLYGKYQQDASQSERETASGARLGGRFVSTEFAESIIDAKERLALKPNWKNTKMYEAKLIVPAKTRMSIGIVAPVTLSTGTVLSGGAPQILLPPNWPEEWIQGYRRVSGRQLQIVPTYWPKKPEEIASGKDSLYPNICPRCCYPHTRKLKDNERVTITGSKGRLYTMGQVCLNPECQYHW